MSCPYCPHCRKIRQLELDKERAVIVHNLWDCGYKKIKWLSMAKRGERTSAARFTRDSAPIMVYEEVLPQVLEYAKSILGT